MTDTVNYRSKYEKTEARDARETIAERKARLAAETAAESLGGMSGKAAEALQSRKSKLDQALKDAGA